MHARKNIGCRVNGGEESTVNPSSAMTVPKASSFALEEDNCDLLSLLRLGR